MKIKEDVAGCYDINTGMVYHFESWWKKGIQFIDHNGWSGDPAGALLPSHPRDSAKQIAPESIFQT